MKENIIRITGISGFLTVLFSPIIVLFIYFWVVTADSLNGTESGSSFKITFVFLLVIVLEVLKILASVGFDLMLTKMKKIVTILVSVGCFLITPKVLLLFMIVFLNRILKKKKGRVLEVSYVIFSILPFILISLLWIDAMNKEYIFSFYAGLIGDL